MRRLRTLTWPISNIFTPVKAPHWPHLEEMETGKNEKNNHGSRHHRGRHRCRHHARLRCAASTASRWSGTMTPPAPRERNHGPFHFGAILRGTDQSPPASAFRRTASLKRDRQPPRGGYRRPLHHSPAGSIYDPIFSAPSWMPAPWRHRDLASWIPRGAAPRTQRVNPALDRGHNRYRTAWSIPSAWLPPTCWTRKNTAPASSPTARCWGCCHQDSAGVQGDQHPHRRGVRVECRR